MPKDEISNPRKAPVLAIDDADDEVIDLLEVVKPGRNLKREAGGDDGDFSADLDAMLDDLSEAGAEGGAPDVPDQPMPFPDPTPVDHRVDLNETLDLPGMDDLDRLLKSFGGSGAGGDKEEREEPDFAEADLDMPDLDALPTPPVAAQKVPPAAPVPAAPDFEDAVPAKAAAKPAQKIVPVSEEDELFASLLAGTAAPPAAGKSGQAAPVPAAGTDEDLFAELGLAFDEGATDDAPSLDDALFAVDAENGKAALEPDPAGKEPVSAGTPPGGLDLPSLEEDNGAAAGAELTDLDDVNLDTLGLEDEEPEAWTKTPPTAAERLAEIPAGADPDDGPDLALTDDGPDDPDIDALAGAERAADLHEDAGFAAGEAVAVEPDGLGLEDGGSVPPEPAAPKTEKEADLPPDGPGGDAEAPASRFDEVDLNELDALLDDMLSTAPASGPGPAAAVAVNGQSAAADAPAEPKPVVPAKAAALSVAAAAQASSGLEDVQARLTGQEAAIKDMRAQLAVQGDALKEQEDKVRMLREDLDALSADTGGQQERLAGHDAEIRGLDQRLSALGGRAAESGTAEEASARDAANDSLAGYGEEGRELARSFSDSNDEVRYLGQRLSEHEAEMQDLVQRFSVSCDQIQIMGQRLGDLADADAGVEEAPRLAALADRVERMEAQLAERTAKCEALEARVTDLLVNMDKLAAEIAAKVIREELAALMESMS